MSVAVDVSGLPRSSVAARRLRPSTLKQCTLSESIQSSILEFDSNSKSALTKIASKLPVHTNYGVDTINIKVSKKKQRVKVEQPKPVEDKAVPKTADKPQQSKKRKVTKAKKAKQKKQKKAAMEQSTVSSSLSTDAKLLEDFIFHISQGNPSVAKACLKSHFGESDESEAYQMEWLATNSTEIFEASMAVEPDTPYESLSDSDVPSLLINANRSTDQWLEHNGPESVEKFSCRFKKYEAQGGTLLYKGRGVAFYLLPTPTRYMEWLAFHSSIGTYWLNTSDAYIQMVTEYEPVTIGCIQLGMSVVRRQAIVPCGAPYMVDKVKAKATRHNSMVSRYGDEAVGEVAYTKPYLVVDNTTKPSPETVEGNDAPPWDEERFMPTVQRLRAAKQHDYEQFKKTQRGIQISLMALKIKRIRAQFKQSMAGVVTTTSHTELASSTHQPSEDNFSDVQTETTKTLYMDGRSYDTSSWASNDDQVHVVVDSQDEADVLHQLQAEFESLSFWERGEIKVRAEDAGVSVHEILNEQNLFTAQYVQVTDRAKWREEAEEIQRYETWFRWKDQATPPVTDMIRYREYWVNLSPRAELQYHLGTMEERNPSRIRGTYDVHECPRCLSTAKHRHLAAVKRESQAATERSRVAAEQAMERFNKRRWGVNSGYPTKAPWCEKPDPGKGKAGAYGAAPKSVKPAAKADTSNALLNEPSAKAGMTKKERSIVSEICQGTTNATAALIPFIQLLTQPMSTTKAKEVVDKYVDRFTETESGLLVPG